MHRHTRLVIFPVLLLLTLPSPALAISASEVARAVEERYSALKDLSADFRQESRLATLGHSRVKSGTIRIEKPGKMRWDYESPEPQTLISDGTTFWFYNPAQKQVVIQEMSRAFTTQTPLLFLFGEGKLEEEFEWEEGDLGEGGIYALLLRPKRETPDLVALTLEVRAADFSIDATVLEDAFGNVTRLEFSGERENRGLDDDIFTFEVPAGTEVVRP